jgi:hypothetical protein
MYSFRRLVFLLALFLPAAYLLPAQETALTSSTSSISSSRNPGPQDEALSTTLDSLPAPGDQAQSSSSSSTQAPQEETLSATSDSVPAAEDQAQSSSSSGTQSPQDQAQQQQESQGQLSVQARIKARREQRRAQAIQETYSNLYELFVGTGYLRFSPGVSLQRVTLYSWNFALSRYYNQKFGVTIDGRGYYGTAFVGLEVNRLTEPAISQYAVMGGPTYRIYRRPKFSLSAHALGGATVGNFSGDLNGHLPSEVGLYPDSTTFAFDGSIIGEINVSPSLSVRVAGDYFGTGFSSNLQNSLGYQLGFVYRFGKQ